MQDNIEATVTTDCLAELGLSKGDHILIEPQPEYRWGETIAVETESGVLIGNLEFASTTRIRLLLPTREDGRRVNKLLAVVENQNILGLVG